MSELKLGKVEFSDPLYEEYPNANKLALEDIDQWFDDAVSEHFKQIREVLIKHGVAGTQLEEIMKELMNS